MGTHKKPLNRSITIGCILFIIILVILLNLANVVLYRNYVYGDYQGYISDLLLYMIDHIDGDDLRICIETGEESDKYKESLLFMDDLMEHMEDIHYFYSVLPLNTNDTGCVMSVLSAERYYDRYIDTEGNLYLGWISDDEYDAATAAQLFDIMDSDSIVYFEEETEWGTDYTGALPIRDSQGNAVAVLAIDIDISFISGMIWEYAIVNSLIVLIAGLIFIAIFLLWSKRNITEPILRLEESAVGFVDHSHGQRSVEALNFEAPQIKTDNEIKSLSNAIVRMTEDMRDYVEDIVSAEEKAENLQTLANRDALTGIRNRTAYDAEILRISQGIAVGETKVGLAMVDLNFLKKINDTYGHDKGNAAIQKLCRIVCVTFSHSPVFRIGGDEFVIILRGNDYDHFDELMEAFNKELEAMSADPSLEPWEKVSAAIGAAFYDPSLDADIDSLLKRADTVMYERKKAMKAVRVD
ncbi:MAG: GGDEF domain-containing protein [Butyrivibrio sp.]|nr:GGDEF domain-containing protein [Butyrivibrio sp.]